jgi:hypothetical protein
MATASPKANVSSPKAKADVSAPETRLGITLRNHLPGCMVTSVSDSGAAPHPATARAGVFNTKRLIFAPPPPPPPPLPLPQVNFVDTNTLGEEEFLFAPYSVFTVLDVRVPTRPSDDDPVVVRALAAVDNLKEEEGLDLAPWY